MCPVCREAMLVLEFDGIDIDRCDRCGGTWLDAGEISLLLERRGTNGDGFRDALGASRAERETDLGCPRCHARLSERTLGQTTEVRVDVCARGHGVWCDRGELAALIDEFGAQSAIVGFVGDVLPSEGTVGPIER